MAVSARWHRLTKQMNTYALLHNNIYDQGYAIVMYNICNDRQTFRYRDETIDLYPGHVTTRYLPELRIDVALIEDVREAKKRGL